MNRETQNGLNFGHITEPGQFQNMNSFVRAIFERNGFIFDNTTALESVSGGLVHYVYRLDSPEKIIYLKIRTSTFSRLPDINIDPDDIQNEKIAMDLLSSKLPEMFPRVLAYDEKNHALFMTDVMPSELTLERLFNAGTVSEEIMLACGKTIARFHKTVETLPSVRTDNDSLVYSNNLLYRLGYLRIPEINKAIEQLEQLPRQLIFGDLSPKNIGINSNNEVTFCDLELVHSGNTVFDIGFLASHILLHSKDKEEGKYRLESFLKGYLNEPNDHLDEELLKVLILGIGLFRLDNPVIPYSLPINEKETKERIHKIREILSSDIKPWSEIIERMTYYA